MSKKNIAKAQKALSALISDGYTYDEIARVLSEKIGAPISGARVWKFIKGKSKSSDILKALDLYKSRHRVYAELRSKNRLLMLKSKLAEIGLSFTELANGIVDGTIEISINTNLKESNESLPN